MKKKSFFSLNYFAGVFTLHAFSEPRLFTLQVVQFNKYGGRWGTNRLWCIRFVDAQPQDMDNFCGLMFFMHFDPGPIAFSDCGNLISNHEHSIPGKLLPRGVTEWGLELKLLAFGPVGVQVWHEIVLTACVKQSASSCMFRSRSSLPMLNKSRS